MKEKSTLSALLAVVALPVVVAGLASVGPSPAVAETSDAPAGKEVFLASKCNMCHGIESQGIERKSKSEKLKGPDLSAAGQDHDAEWMSRYPRKEEKKDGEAHDKEFKGSDEELAALTTWLATLKSGS